MEWIATAIAVIAAAAAVWQAFEARRSRSAADASSRSASDASDRMAAALEEQTRIARESAEAYGDPWRFFEVPGGSTRKWKFVLEGDEPAHEIEWKVDPGDKHFNMIGEVPTEMVPGDAVVVTWFRLLGSPAAQKLTITWHRPGETDRRTSRATLTM